MFVDKKRNGGSEKKDMTPMLRAASFLPNTYNESNNTIDLIAATETKDVLQVGWEGLYREVLSMEEGQIRLARLNSGANVLDNHNKYESVRQVVVGVVEKSWIQDRQLHVTMRFSNREDVKPLIQDVRDGIVKNISVGYRVYAYEITEEVGQIPVYRAIDWEPFEVSFVPVPADYMAGVRNNNSSLKNEVEVIHTKQTRTVNTRNEGGSAAPGATNEPAAGSTATPPTVQPAKPATPVQVVNEEEVRSRAAKLERDRAAGILTAVRAANLPQAYAEELIGNEAMTIDLARAAIIDKMVATQSPVQTRSANPGVTVVTDENDKRRKGMNAAILVRAGVNTVKEDGKEVRLDAGEFRGLTLVDMAREALEASGTKTRGMSQREIATAGLGIGDNTRAALSTSDFPLILGNTINRSLRNAYDLAERTFMPFCRRGSAKDFRDKTVTQLGDLASIDAIEESGEYKFGKVDESAEKYRVAKYGKIIPITWETLVNDDLDAFGRIPQTLANACAQKQSDLVYAILTGNPTMADTIALFDVNTHKNYTSAGTDISVVSLGVARAMLRKQKSPGGSFLNLRGKYLVVGPDKEQVALQYLSTNYVATKGSDINVWQGSMTPIVEGRLTGNQWYVFADPAMIDTIEYAFLDGEEIFTEQRIGFEVDGLQVKVRMVFGVKAIEYRSMYKNVGA